MKGDLHIHTIFSDGIYTNEEAIDIAHEKRLSVMALTNHDSFKGVFEAKEYALGKGIRLIPAIELSTYHQKEPVHLLGYFKNDLIEEKQKLKDFLDLQKKIRDIRCKKICVNLKKYENIEIDYRTILKENLGIITRGHIANEIIKHYPYSREELFKGMLSNESRSYVESSRLTVLEGVEMLRRHNALVFLAHPVLLKTIQVEEIIAYGIDGIEAHYPYNKKEDTKRLIAIAKKNRLLVSGGSDCHGINDEKHKEIGYCVIENGDLKKFLEAVYDAKK